MTTKTKEQLDVLKVAVKQPMPNVSERWTDQERVQVIDWLNGSLMIYIQERRQIPSASQLIGVLESIRMVTSYGAGAIESNRYLIEDYGTNVRAGAHPTGLE